MGQWSWVYAASDISIFVVVELQLISFRNVDSLLSLQKRDVRSLSFSIIVIAFIIHLFIDEIEFLSLPLETCNFPWTFDKWLLCLSCFVMRIFVIRQAKLDSNDIFMDFVVLIVKLMMFFKVENSACMMVEGYSFLIFLQLTYLLL